MKRAQMLVAAGAVSMVGWGSILPYQYAYASQTRGWGTLVAASAASLFSVGALVAAPVAGRLADRMSPARVAIAAKVLSAVATGSMILAASPWTFLLAMLVFGVSIAAAAPAQSVLVLGWVGPSSRRTIFALQFAGQSVGMAVGAFAAGFVVDLHRTDGMTTAFAAASIGFLLSAGLVAWAARPATAKDQEAPELALGPVRSSEMKTGSESSSMSRGSRGSQTSLTSQTSQTSQTSRGVRSPAVQTAPSTPEPSADETSAWGAVRLIVGTPALRWTAIVAIALALGFYAQFESGLPAYAMTILEVSPQTVGTASAVNCLVIVALQMLVVRLTAKASGPSLLVVVGVIWVLSWGLLAFAAVAPGLAGTMFIVAFGVFAAGETMYSPVLNPLTASLAPAGLVGTVLGLFAALQTGVSAAGPLLSGVILGSGHGNIFVAVHVSISLVAVGAAWRLQRLLRVARNAAPATGSGPASPRTGTSATADRVSSSSSAPRGELLAN